MKTTVESINGKDYTVVWPDGTSLYVSEVFILMWEHVLRLEDGLATKDHTLIFRWLEGEMERESWTTTKEGAENE